MSGVRSGSPEAGPVWLRSHKYDPIGAALADGHYSRRKIGSPQFMPPGETLVLVSPDGASVFGWWRPDPRSGIKGMNGLDGWTCTIFRRTGGTRASDAILAAESELVAYATERWSGTAFPVCGPDGLLSYVWKKKVRSSNPGFCFKCAGWRAHPTKPKSTKGKLLLWKPWPEAGEVRDAA